MLTTGVVIEFVTISRPNLSPDCKTHSKTHYHEDLSEIQIKDDKKIRNGEEDRQADGCLHLTADILQRKKST